MSSLARGPIVRGAAVDGTERGFDVVGREAAVPVAQASGSRAGFLVPEERAGKAFAGVEEPADRSRELPQLPWRETALRDDCAVLLLSLRTRRPVEPGTEDVVDPAAGPGRDG